MFYFAYGSNLSKKQMLERCPDAKPRLIATLPNYKLVFVGWSRKWHGGVATLRRSTGGKVPGAIYEISEPCLQRLDRYEEGYTRFKVTVFDDIGNAVEAIAYVKSGQPEEAPPSKEYLAVIQQGYRDWDIT
ncbi:MAG: gamma-glutamylcyclotransferase family protein [Chloroflexota bacterium]|nr:gamma-glutamylcyclotransferase family protein [Chloroflexota bacterium]